jgi:DNA polymerase-3 subunit gamma/tau
MSIFVKYEPKKIDGILGNEEIKIIIEGFLNKKEIPQCYLFHGAYGCGKTLFSNLIAKELNCENNIYELNASNDRGIDAIRRIIENSQFKSLNNKPKAFIIDEAHQLPTLSQEALLTTLQKPPKNTYFFFCTTELNKIIKTIQSRCQKLEVEKVSKRKLYPYLIDISIKENNEITKKVARQIVEISEGHVRDSLSILERILEFKDEEKQLKAVKEKTQENSTIIDLCRLLMKENNFSENIRKCLIDLQNENPESLRKVIINYMMKAILNNGNRRAALIIDCLENIVYDYPVFVKNIYNIFV